MELVLGGFGMATTVCLLLLVGLRSRYARLAKRTAALAEHAAESVRSNHAKRQFVGSLTHELRTPLNAIVGFADLMSEQRLGPLGEEHQECIEDIRVSAHHMLDLVNEALDMARIESGRVALHPQPVDPAQVVAECVESVRSLAGENDVTVTVQARPLGIALLDPARLRQVVLNYLSNAIKFTPPGGVIVVRAARVVRHLLIEVTDTGCGIDPEHQRRVFDEFEQLDGGYRGGTGLGLAVTKQIVEAHGGTVGVQSEPGKGSTFFARLPFTSAPAAIPIPARTPVPALFR